MSDETEDLGNGPFSKLFASIVTSSIWTTEKDHVRLVWITMLAICDKRGVVRAAVPGLANVARQSIENTLDALDRLMSPDPWSRTRDHDGRRIEVVEGGWRLLNYAAYRDRQGEHSHEISMTSEAIRKRRQRSKERDNTDRDSVTVCDAGGTASASASASASGDTVQEKGQEPLNSQSVTPRDRVTAFVEKYGFGRFHDEVEGYLRASRKPLAVIAELELWLTGELNRRKTDPETLGEALNAYNAATDPLEGFKTNYFGGFVRGVHRNHERNDGNRRNSAEGKHIAAEERAAEERRKEELDRQMLTDFERSSPDRSAELRTAAEAAIGKQFPKSIRTGDVWMTLVNDELIRLVKRETKGP